jgi:hypothetical protein
MLTIDLPIAADAWKVASGHNGHATAISRPRPNAVTEAAQGDWRPAIDQIVAMRQLADDWDGLGASAPSPELLESALGLAHMFEERGVDPPSAIAPGVDGSVLLVWQFADGSYSEIEIDRPLHAEAMLIQPGKPAHHWVLPSE